jgi:hypothetical protein
MTTSTVWTVSRDGERRASFDTYTGAAAFLLGVQGQSIDWACKWEGWAISREDVGGIE